MRGVAAMIVAAFHVREIVWVGLRSYWQTHGWSFAPTAMLGYATFPLVWGAIGVPIFFVISGYCIHRGPALARARGTLTFSSGVFWLRRFFRIYPVLVGALLLTLLCDWISRHYQPLSYKLGDAGAGAFLVNLLSLQGVLGQPYGSNYPLWTLSIEVQFYGLYPLLLSTMMRLGNRTTLAVLAALNVASYVLLERNGYVLFSSYYVSWYLGALVAEAEARGILANRLVARRFRVACYIASFALLCGGNVLFFSSAYWAFQVWAFAFAIFLSAVLRRPARSPGALLRLLRWLGSFSYSINIVHMPICVLICSVVFNSAHQDNILPIFPIFAVIIVCAYLFSLIFEKPALALSQSFGRTRLAAGSAMS